MTTYEMLATILTGATLLAGPGTVIWKCVVLYNSPMGTKKDYEQEKEARKCAQEQIAKLLHGADEMRVAFVWRGMLFYEARSSSSSIDLSRALFPWAYRSHACSKPDNQQLGITRNSKANRGWSESSADYNCHNPLQWI